MNIPENMREFDLALAQAKHPICTRAGREAKFIAYVPENEPLYQVVVAIDGQVFPLDSKGHYTERENTCYDLFLAPLGYCEGKPVFTNDRLLDDQGHEFTVSVSNPDWLHLTGCKWPSKAPVIETKLSYGELETHYYKFAVDEAPEDKFTWSSTAARNLANKAVEHSIAGGDVIPIIAVKNLMKEMTKYDWDDADGSEDTIESYINAYLQGLNK